MPEHCCELMATAVESECEQHPVRHDCPDALLAYSSRFDEYGILIHDGGLAVCQIQYCPWCGKCLPDSKRDRWFDELEAKGISDPDDDNVPSEYLSDAWYRGPNRAA